MPRALRHGSEEGPGQQDRPVLEGPARRSERPVTEAARALEAIVRNKPVKEVNRARRFSRPPRSALANLSLQTGTLDEAIRRFEDLSGIARPPPLPGAIAGS